MRGFLLGREDKESRQEQKAKQKAVGKAEGRKQKAVGKRQKAKEELEVFRLQSFAYFLLLSAFCLLPSALPSADCSCL